MPLSQHRPRGAQKDEEATQCWTSRPAINKGRVNQSATLLRTSRHLMGSEHLQSFSRSLYNFFFLNKKQNKKLLSKSPLAVAAAATAAERDKKCLKASWRRCYYLHRSRELMSPVCGILTTSLYSFIIKSYKKQTNVNLQKYKPTKNKKITKKIQNLWKYKGVQVYICWGNLFNLKLKSVSTKKLNRGNKHTQNINTKTHKHKKNINTKTNITTYRPNPQTIWFQKYVQSNVVYISQEVMTAWPPELLHCAPLLTPSQICSFCISSLHCEKYSVC